MKKVLFMYATAFALIWTGYGIYAVITEHVYAYSIFGIGLAFSLVIYAAAWVAYWLSKHYKKIDAMAKDSLKQKQQERNIWQSKRSNSLFNKGGERHADRCTKTNRKGQKEPLQ